ncbi:MAG: hypothetical protein Tsb0027_19640 [Wenzhouxiangellaceae bacterium]
MQHYEAQIDAYVRGKLSPAEQSALEVEVLENPDMLMEFEMAVAMRKGVQQLDTPLVKEVKSSYWWQPWIGKPMVTGVTMAVAVVALVQLASLSSRGDLSKDDQMPSALSANVPILTFSRIRSARENTDFSVVVDKDAIQSGLAVLELEIDWPPQPVYEVTIAAQSQTGNDRVQTPLARAAQQSADARIQDVRQDQLASTVYFKPQTLLLNPDARGYLVMAMPASQLSAGDYVISINPLTGDQAAASSNPESLDSAMTMQQSVADNTSNNREVTAQQAQSQQIYTLRVKSAN